MTKPLKQIIFVPANGVWQDVAGDSGTLADTLARYDIILDDKTEFARIRDYENNLYILIKCGAMKVTMTIWQMREK